MGAPRPRVVVTHWVHDEVRSALAEFADVVAPTRDEGVWPRSVVADRAPEADGLIVCMADRIDDEFLAGCPRLRVVSATLKGYDNFDAAACARRGVWLTVVPTEIIGPTAELAVGLLIGVIRRVSEGHDLVRSGRFAGWRPQLYGSTLVGATVGLVGMGQLGRAVAHRLAGFEAELVYHDLDRLSPEEESDLGMRHLELASLLRHSDAVVVLLPLTDRTRDLIGAAELRSMPTGAVLVNVGRGSVVDETAVAKALDTGRLGGYGADVFAMEDWALPGHPDGIPAALRDHPRTLLTPHLGSAADEVRLAMSLQAARQVLEGGRPDHPVNQPVQ